MLPVEVHHCSRFPRLRSWAFTVAVVAALVAAYAAVQYHDDNVAQRAELQTLKARGCPGRMQGKILAGNVYQEIDLSRPRFSTLRCYYKVGITS